jgi:hypothetical protein
MKHLTFYLSITIAALIALSSCNNRDAADVVIDLRNNLTGTYKVDTAYTYVRGSDRALRIYSSTTERAVPVNDSTVLDTTSILTLSKDGYENFKLDLKLPNGQFGKVTGFQTMLKKSDSLSFTIQSTEFDALNADGTIDTLNRNSVILAGTSADATKGFPYNKNLSSGFLQLTAPNKLYIAVTGFHKQFRYRATGNPRLDTVYQTPFTIYLKATKRQ